MTPDLVLFDCDGVLVDSEPASNAVLLEDMRAFGLDLTLEECMGLFTGGTFKSAGEEARRRGAAVPDDWAKGFYPRLYATLAKGVPLIPGAIELIDSIEAAGIATGIVSNGAKEKMEITLGPHGLMDRFEGRIFSAYDYGVSKPDPELVCIAVRHFNIDPQRTVFVDDSVSGCRAGHAAGMYTIGFSATTPAEKLSDYCQVCVSTMSEIEPHLGL